MSGRLAGKVALVTGSTGGATSGLGRAIALRFAAEGAQLVVTGRNAHGGADTVRAIEAAGGEAAFVGADLTIETDVQALMAAAVSRFGRLDILVNAAAATETITDSDDQVHRLETAAWEAIMQGAATVTYLACKHALPRMIESGGGAIVNLSTAAARRGNAGFAGHSASKAAIEALTRSIAVECGSHNIRANALGVGFILAGAKHEAMAADPRIGAMLRAAQLTRYGTAADVANAALFLASDEAGFITGAVLPVDGGTTCRMPVVVELTEIGKDAR